jgi:hypothetical protein
MNKMSITAAVVAAVVGAAPAVALDGTPIASAATDPAVHNLGDQGTLVDGSTIQGWTISGLQKSTDTVPYAAQGTLWEATATDEALQSGVVPIVSNLNARTQSGREYRTLFQVATPQGVNPGALTQGQKTTGKLYFDVTDEPPDSVVYEDGADDRLIWVQPPAPTQRTGMQPPRPTAVHAAPDASSTDTAPGVPSADMEPASPVGQSTPPPPGWQGTPLPAGQQGTPLPLGQQGTPLPPVDQGEPTTPPQTAVASAPADGLPAVAATGSGTVPPPTDANGAPLQTVPTNAAR